MGKTFGVPAASPNLEIARSPHREWLSPHPPPQEWLQQLVAFSTLSQDWGPAPTYPLPDTHISPMGVVNAVEALQWSQVPQVYPRDGSGAIYWHETDNFSDAATYNTPYMAGMVGSSVVAEEQLNFAQFLPNCVWVLFNCRGAAVILDPFATGSRLGRNCWVNGAVAIRTRFQASTSNAKAWLMKLNYTYPNFTFDPSTGAISYGPFNVPTFAASFIGYAPVAGGIWYEPPMPAVPLPGLGGVLVLWYWEPALTPQVWESETGITLSGL